MFFYFKNNHFYRKIYKSIVFTFVLFLGILIIGIGSEYINTATNNPMVISGGMFTIESTGIIITAGGAFLLLFLIRHSNFEISLMSLVLSSLVLITMFFSWDFLGSFGSSWTYSSLNFDVILISFLAFWNINIFKNLFESKY